jgi:hypothetical protein
MKKDRICLMCEGVFLSPGPHVRRCGTCCKLLQGINWYHQNNKDWDDAGTEHYYLKRGHRKGKRTRSRIDDY